MKYIHKEALYLTIGFLIAIIFAKIYDLKYIEFPKELPYTISKDSLNPDTVLIYKNVHKYIIKIR